MTLTDFLLARIAEDEVWVTEHYAGATIGILPPDAERIVPIPGSIDRVLAECEAKRRIVEWASDGEGEFHWMSVLHPLALPYADHPDYDESWRP